MGVVHISEERTTKKHDSYMKWHLLNAKGRVIIQPMNLLILLNVILLKVLKKITYSFTFITMR